MRHRTEATGGPKEAEVIAGKVEVASNKDKEPASASPSQSEYTYSPTESITAKAKEGIQEGDVVHVITTAEMNRMTEMLDEIQKQLAIWAQRKSRVVPPRPAATTATATATITGGAQASRSTDSGSMPHQ